MTAPRTLRSRCSIYGRELPPACWVLWFGTVVHRVGGFAVPFLMLYLTTRLGISPVTAALMVSVLGAGSFIAQLTGGELADRFGRRPVMLLSLFISPVAMVILGLVREPLFLVSVMFVLGFFTVLNEPSLSTDVCTVIQTLGLTSPVLIGHSMAGAELTGVGMLHSDRLGGLVYLDAIGDSTDDPPDDPTWKALQAKLPPSGPPPVCTSDRSSFAAFRAFLQCR